MRVVWIVVTGLLLASTAMAAEAPMTPRPEIQVAINCIEPIRPILPIKPYWCTGAWTQILECTPTCQCQWRPVCLQ